MSSCADSSDRHELPFSRGELLSDTYQLLEDVGFGAMGQVIAAHDRRLNRRVAVKVAWKNEPPERLRAEAQALAAVEHPGLPKVYALAEHRGHDYMVMELIRGEGLDEHLGRLSQAGELMPVPKALDLLVAVADALNAVHRTGLVHRDVKPSNIMLAHGERVVLIDFGLFLPQFEPGRQGRVQGSPWYMAPELIRNKVEAGCWHLVDLYALGVVAYELVAGQPPFSSVDVRDVLRAHVRSEVPDITETRDDIPASLAALIRELLAKSPLERPQSAESLCLALQTVRSHVRRDERDSPFEVLVASSQRPPIRTLAAQLRKVMPDVGVRSVTHGDQVYEVVERRVPDVALMAGDLPGANALELAMFLRGSSATCTIGWMGAFSDGVGPLLDHLEVERLPALGTGDSSAIVQAVRRARRRKQTDLVRS